MSNELLIFLAGAVAGIGYLIIATAVIAYVSRVYATLKRRSEFKRMLANYNSQRATVGQ